MHKYRAIDLPRNCRFLLEGYGKEAIATFDEIIAEKGGQWDRPQDFVFDITDPEFSAYWLKKSDQPYTSDREGDPMLSELEKHRACQYSLVPEGTQIQNPITMSAVGDLMFAINIQESRGHLYSEVEDLIFDADIKYANLESTLSDEDNVKTGTENYGDTPYINVSIDDYQALTRHKNQKFNILQLANNHILDCGYEGLAKTAQQVINDGALPIGVYLSEEDAYKPQISEHKGIKIGWVAHTFSVNFKPFPEGKEWLVNMTNFHTEIEPDTSMIESQIKACRADGCDLVIVTLHWGLEHEFIPTKQQQEWAHRFADFGADAIIGHHPHVMQGVEIYQPCTDPQKRIPIIYSLGNLTPGFASSATVLSLVARFNFGSIIQDGKTKVALTSLKLTPVAFLASEIDGKTVSKLVPIANLNSQNIAPSDKQYVDEIIEYTQMVFGDDWKKSRLPIKSA